MLHILRSGETQAGERVLRAMFAARKQVFVDLLKWNVPVVAGTYEMDLRSCADAFGRERLGHTHRPPGRIRWRGSIAKRGSHASASPSRRTRQTNLL